MFGRQPSVLSVVIFPEISWLTCMAIFMCLGFRRETTTSTTAPSDKQEDYVSELIELNSQLEIVNATPLTDYEPSRDADSHGIVGFRFLTQR